MKRSEAAEIGLSKYETGSPCSRGHNSPRYTNTGACVECVKGYAVKYKKAAIRTRLTGWIDHTEHMHRDDIPAVHAYVVALTMERQAARREQLDTDIAAKRQEKIEEFFPPSRRILREEALDTTGIPPHVKLLEQLK